MKGSEDIPAGWTTVALSSIAEVRLGRQRSPARATGPNMRPYMRAANVTWKGIDTSDVKEMDFTPSEYATYALRVGDILLSEASGSPSEVGKPAVWRGEVPECCIQNTLIRVRLGDLSLVRFLHLHFLKDATNGRFAATSRGVGIHHLGAEALVHWSVTLPPLPEQHRIVAAIEDYFSRLDEAVALLERVQRNLKRYRASVLKAAVEGRLVPTEAELARTEGRTYEPASVLLERILEERRRRWEQSGRKGKYQEPSAPDTTDLPELPEGWCWASIEQVSHVGTGATPKRGEDRYWGSGSIPWVTSGATNQAFVKEVGEYVTEAALRETNLTLYPPGTLVVAMYGEGLTRGRCTELAIEATTNQALAAIVLGSGDGTLKRWLRIFLEHNYLGLRRAASGGVQPNLNLSIIKGTLVPIAPRPEMERVLLVVDSMLLSTVMVGESVDVERRRCIRLRQSILKWAFEGRLADQDPTDEPAAVLLERIRAERATNAAKVPRRRRQGGSPSSATITNAADGGPRP